MGVDASNTTAPPPVVVDDPGTAGMAFVTAQLMEKAVARSPELASRIKGSFALWTTDYRTGVTVRFEGSRVSIIGKRVDDAWLVIEGGALALARLGGGDHSLATLRNGEIKVPVAGLIRHPVFALRLRRLLTG